MTRAPSCTMKACRRRTGFTCTVRKMTYFVGAERVKLLRLKTLRPGTRVADTETLPSGPYHAVEGLDAAEALCGTTVAAIFEQTFTESDGLKCEQCEELAKQQ